MKKLICLSVLASTMAVGAAFLPEKSSPIEQKAEVATPKPEKFDPVVAKAGADKAAALAAKPMATEDVSSLSLPEVEAKISEIDEYIARNRLIERSNAGTLSDDEMLAIRQLLHKRNVYFDRKVDIDLGEG